MFSFVWDDWNVGHIAKHGVTAAEAEWVVNNARPPFPKEHGDDKYLVRGQTQTGEYVQVIYLFEAEAHVDYQEIDLATYDPDAENVYVIHARPLTRDEKRNFRK
ncbi:MAG: hypothetical protein ACAI43_03120 [Phycisphaerae bacterium]|nr:hypothetical protein [Tepidisphaeraceae bacterium]